MSGRGHPSAPTGGAIRLYGRRVMLRPLTAADWQQWSEVRQRNEQWLTPWEPLRPANLLDPTRDRDAFSARCSARDRDRQMGIAFGFGVFVGAEFAGEINLNGIVRGAHQGGTIGYWIDRQVAGRGIVRALEAAMHAEGETILHEGMSAWTDAALLNDAGIPAICYGPGDIILAHADEEWIPMDEVERATRVLARLAQDWMRGTVA